MKSGIKIESDDTPSGESVLDKIGEAVSEIFVEAMKENLYFFKKRGRDVPERSPTEGTFGTRMTSPHLETFPANDMFRTIVTYGNHR